MFHSLVARLRIEGSHFQALTPDVRRLLVSYALYLAAYPLVMTFVNAYLWRARGDLWAILVYNAGYICSLPLGFLLNGFLLKKIQIFHLYFVGALLQGAAAFLVVFFPTQLLAHFFLFGFVYGFGGGLYWGNKNYLSLQLTRNTNRVYYNSIEQITDLLLNIIVPASAGWFIALTSVHGILVPSSAYKIVIVVGFLFLFLAGAVVQSVKIKKVAIKNLVLRKPSRSWNIMRLFNVLYNIQVGLNLIVSSVLILVLVGNEGILGTLQAITAGLSALLLYGIGRKTTINNSWKLVGLGSLLFLVTAGVLAGVFTWIGGLTYAIMTTIIWALQWSSSYSVAMDLMDQEETNADAQYAYVCDNEIFFNIGRGLGIGLVVCIIVWTTERTALQWAPLIVALIQIPLAWLIFLLVKTINRRNAIHVAVPKALD